MFLNEPHTVKCQVREEMTVAREAGDHRDERIEFLTGIHGEYKYYMAARSVVRQLATANAHSSLSIA